MFKRIDYVALNVKDRAREPKEEGWRRVVFLGPDGEQIEFRG